MKKSPESGRVLHYWGNIQRGKGNLDEALKWLLKSEEQWPTQPQLQLDLIEIKLKIDPDWPEEEIEEHYQKAVKRGGYALSSYGRYARWLMKRKRYTDARKVVEKGLKRIKPKNEKRQKAREKLEKLRLKVLEKAAGESEDFINTLKAEIEKEPTAKKYRKLANKYYKLAQYEESVAASDEAIKLAPKGAENYNMKCIALIKWGKHDQAIAGLQ